MKKILSAFAITALFFAVSAEANQKPTPKAKVAKTKAAKAKKPVKKPIKETSEAAPTVDENGQQVRTMQDELLAE